MLRVLEKSSLCASRHRRRLKRFSSKTAHRACPDTPDISVRSRRQSFWKESDAEETTSILSERDIPFSMFLALLSHACVLCRQAGPPAAALTAVRCVHLPNRLRCSTAAHANALSFFQLIYLCAASHSHHRHYRRLRFFLAPRETARPFHRSRVCITRRSVVPTATRVIQATARAN